MSNNLFKKSLEEILAEHNSNMPRKRPDDEEHRIQCDCVNWFHYQYPKYNLNLFAVPNGGRRDKVTAGKLKAEGVVAGVSDLILALRTYEYGALFIEMKTEKGKQSESQKIWQRKMEQDGYKYVVCHSFDEFKYEVEEYLKDII